MKTKCLITGLIVLLANLAAYGGDEQKYPVAIWLVPAPEQQRQIQGIISDLAAKHSRGRQYVPVFQPHATLCAGELKSNNVEKGLRDLLDQVKIFAGKHEELSLAVKGAERRKRWSRFLILPLDFSASESNKAPDEALNQETANKTFDALSSCEIVTDDEAKKTPPPLIPHISLMYSGIEDRPGGITQQANEDNFPGIVQEVANNYNSPKQVVFQSIQVVTPISGDWRDILRENSDVNRTWKVLKTFPLKSAEFPGPLHMVVAGGQTGVDQAAWRAARLNHIVIGGWCPPQRDIGNGNFVPKEFACTETPDNKLPSSDIERSERTVWNVRDSDAVLILQGLKLECIDATNEPDKIPFDTDDGTRLTIKSAQDKSAPDPTKHPTAHPMICDPSKIQAVGQVVRWIRANKVQTLDIGGPSEAQEPGIGAKAEQFLLRCLLNYETRASRDKGELVLWLSHEREVCAVTAWC